MYEPAARASMARTARQLQARWGCPVAGHSPPKALPPDLTEIGEEWAETVGLVPLRLDGDPPAPAASLPRTCPFAGSYRLSEWQREVLRADRLMSRSKGGLRWRDVTGREPTARDIEGLDAIAKATAAVTESDMAIIAASQPKAP